MSEGLPRVAVLGAGKVGSAIARLLTDAGYPVAVAGSGDPRQIALVADVLMPKALIAWAADAAAAAEVVILAVPLHRFRSIDSATLKGKIVVDAMNYWPPINGRLDEFEVAHTGSTEIVQRALPASVVVKTLGHLTYYEIEGDRRPAGDPDRRAIAVVGPSTAAGIVAEMIDAIGFDPVQRTRIEAGRALQPGGPAFGAHLRRAELEDLIDRWEQAALTA